jgi:tRNA (mo5U34)-methyltransferase
MTAIDIKLKKVLKYHDWRQKIFLKDGYFTPGHISNDIYSHLSLPSSLENKSFLDIGSNDGQLVFEAEKRGASKIIASDLYIDKLDTMSMGWPVEGIEILKEYFNSKIEIHRKGLFGLNELNDKFDYVILNNVINWVGDIDEAIKRTLMASKNIVIFSDQFLKNNKGAFKEKPLSKNLEVFDEMCNLNYLLSKINEN